MLKLQHFGHLMWRADSLEMTLVLQKTEDRRRSRKQRMRWLDSITDSMDRSLNKLWEIVEDRETWRATIPGFAKRHNLATEQEVWFCDYVKIRLDLLEVHTKIFIDKIMRCVEFASKIICMDLYIGQEWSLVDSCQGWVMDTWDLEYLCTCKKFFIFNNSQNFNNFLNPS